jgi:hypothetical protein
MQARVGGLNRERESERGPKVRTPTTTERGGGWRQKIRRRRKEKWPIAVQEKQR